METKEAIIALPEKFSGDKCKTRPFLVQLDLVFFASPSRYSTEEVKIALLGSLLTGKAADWFCCILSNRALLCHEKITTATRRTEGSTKE
jgi:hypothetical protein